MLRGCPNTSGRDFAAAQKWRPVTLQKGGAKLGADYLGREQKASSQLLADADCLLAFVPCVAKFQRRAAASPAAPRFPEILGMAEA